MFEYPSKTKGRSMYLQRNLKSTAEVALNQFPIITLLGPRQAGKTTFARSLRPDWQYFDLEKTSHYRLIAEDPELFFQQFPQYLIIDEAQQLPELFRILRGVVDEKRHSKGRFIITGSSSPELIKQISETLAGRIAILHLSTLKSNEFYQRELSPFYKIFNNTLDKQNVAMLVKQPPAITMHEMQYCWLKGGYPEPLLAKDDDFYQRWMQNYQDTYINRDIGRLFPKLNHYAYQRFLTTLSKLSGTIINKSDLARSVEISEGSIREYLQIADGTFLWRTIPAFTKNPLKTLVKSPKGYIRDPGLLHYLLKINAMDQLLLDPKVGHSFESFVIEEIIKGLEASNISNWNVTFYRTHGGSEIDLIIDGPFGVLPIEIKMASNVSLKSLSSMIQFIETNNLPFGVLINQASSGYWLHPKVVQIPIGYL